jgi:hypothetical protein
MAIVSHEWAERGGSVRALGGLVSALMLVVGAEARADGATWAIEHVRVLPSATA